MRSLIIGAVSLLVAIWMGAGRWLFGVGGSYTGWYLLTISVPYTALLWYTLHRMRVSADRGRPAGRAAYVSIVLSWVCALGFGYTVPDRVDGELWTILSLFAGQEHLGFAIGVCNPLGIIAFTLAGVALAVAIARGRDPRPEDDDDYEPRMVPHPYEFDR